MKKITLIVLFLLFLLSTFAQWSHQNKITASDRFANNQFGNSTAISGNYAVVANAVGAIYIYHNIEGIWQEIQKITGADVNSGGGFGRSTAISGNYIVIGSSSSTCFFKNNNGTWQLTQKINIAGYSVAISGDFTIIGTRIYHNNNGVWELHQQLSASDNSGGFDYSVAISGDYALVSAPMQHDFNGNQHHYYEEGAVFVFFNNNGIWQEQQRIIASDGYSYGMFGYTLAISGNNIIIGGNEKYDPGMVNTVEINKGYIYIYTKYEETWEEVRKSSYFIAESSGFGSSVSISDNCAIIGAPNYFELPEYGNNFDKTGAVFLFHKKESNWSRSIILATDKNNGDNFGKSVAISNHYAFIGAPGNSHDINGSNPLGKAGSVYILKGPAISKHPNSLTNICANSIATFNIEGNNISTYQWQISTDNGLSFHNINDGRVYSGTQTSSISFKVRSLMNNNLFRCIISSFNENVISGTAKLTIDSEKPVFLTIHQDQVINKGYNCEAILPDYTQNTSLSDNCDETLEVKQSPPPGTIISGNINEINITATDASGNVEKSNFNVAVMDNPPFIECSENKTILISGRNNTYTATRTEFDPVVTDDCVIKSIVNDFNNKSTLGGANFPIGTTSINWLVTDQAGNTASCKNSVTIYKKTRLANLSKFGISIYPNPTKALLNLNFGNNKVKRMIITDLNGKVYLDKKQPQAIELINLSFLKNDFYFVNIQTDNEIFTTKIVKEN